jgi:cephalosporin hydroxylase
VTIPELFQRLPAIHEKLDGWADLTKAETLASLIVAFRPAVVVEIGVYGGASLIPMALACQAVNRGIVIGIDPWSREVAIREQTTDKDREWWANLDLEKIRTDFMARIAEYQLEKFVRIERKESRQIEPPNGISILHVDGAHSNTATLDITRFAPRVIVGGYCVTDDTEWTGGGVSRGERWLLENGFARIAALGTGHIFQRLK